MLVGFVPYVAGSAALFHGGMSEAAAGRAAFNTLLSGAAGGLGGGATVAQPACRKYSSAQAIPDKRARVGLHSCRVSMGRCRGADGARG